MSSAAPASVVVAIGGASGAGKSLVAEDLLRSFQGEALILREDAYCHDQRHIPWPERANVNVDHPAAIDHELMAVHLAELRRGAAIEVPTYEYATFSRRPERQGVVPRPLVIVEGILVLAADILGPFIDVRVYVDAPPDLCLHRRLLRDRETRGLDFEHTLRQYLRTIRPMYQSVVEPTRAGSDFVVSNHGVPSEIRLEPVRAAIAARLVKRVRACGCQ